MEREQRIKVISEAAEIIVPVYKEGERMIPVSSEAIPVVPRYSGATTVTPSSESQVLETNGLLLNENITIEPIPNNYGLITWNGSILTVS